MESLILVSYLLQVSNWRVTEYLFVGKIIAIVVSVVSSVALLTVAMMIVLYIWKHRYIQKKREGISQTKSFDHTVKCNSKLLKSNRFRFLWCQKTGKDA